MDETTTVGNILIAYPLFGTAVFLAIGLFVYSGLRRAR
jgi:hypothetical protein